MPKFTILSRVDAFVDYLTEVEAATVEAVDRCFNEGRAERASGNTGALLNSTRGTLWLSMRMVKRSRRPPAVRAA